MTDKEDYLVTLDTVPTLQNRLGVELDSSEERQVRQIEAFYIGKFSEYTPEDLQLTLEDSRDIQEWSEDKLEESNYPVVSLDDVYVTEGVIDLGVTRTTDKSNEKVELGTRNPENELDQKLSSIASELDYINLYDIGMFEGDTVREIVNRFKNRDTSVETVYSPITNKEIVSEIQDDLGIDIESYRTFEAGEWLEGRDIAGIDGRKTGKKVDGVREIIPYSENPDEWASIPSRNAGIASDIMEKLFEELSSILDLDEEVVGKRVSL